MSEQKVQVTILGDASQLMSTLGVASKGVEGMAREMQSALGGLQKMLLGFTALFGGAEFLKETISETKNWTVEAQKLARVLGITTEQASVLNLAIGDIYGTQEEYLGAVAKLTKTLNTNEDAFHKLGVETRDQNGRLRDTPSIMAEVNQKLMQMKSGTDRNIASAQIYGKSWMEVQRYLKLTPEVMEEARKKAERLNLIVGSDAVEATNAYRGSVNDLEDTVKALKIRIGKELMPLMTEFNNAASEKGPDALNGLGVAIKTITTFFKTLAEIIKFTSVIGITALMAWWEGVSGIANALSLVFQGKFKEAKEAVKNGWSGIKREMSAGADQIKADYAQFGLELNYVWDPSLRPRAKTKPGDTAAGAATPKGKEEPDKDFERLKAKLAAEKDSYEQRQSAEGTFLQYTKEMENQFWLKALATQDLEGNSLAKAQQAQFAAAHEARKKKHSDDLALDEVYRQRYIAEQMALFDEEGQLVDTQLRNGEITDQQAIAWKQAIERDKFELELQGLNDRLAIKGLEPVEIARINGQIEALAAAHQVKVRELTNMQADLDRQKDGWAGWATGIREALKQGQNYFEIFRNAATQVLNGIENAFATGLQGILSGQMSLAQGMKAIWQGIVQTVIQAIAQLIAKWVVMTAVGSTLKGTENAADGARTTASLTTAAAETWAAYSWIPFIGPAIAEAQIAAMGVSMAAAAAVASVAGKKVATGAAEGGWFGEPTNVVLGEGKRPELVVPDVAFKDFAANLSANILAQERQAQGYARQAAGYASASRGGDFGAVPTVQHITHIHGHFIDSSERGRRMLGEINTDAGRSFYREHQSVIRYGEVAGGL